MKTAFEMAREAGLLIDSSDRMSTSRTTAFHVESCYFDIERFAALVRADEREAAEERVVDLFTDMETPYLPDIVTAIRTRSNT